MTKKQTRDEMAKNMKSKRKTLAEIASNLGVSRRTAFRDVHKKSRVIKKKEIKRRVVDDRLKGRIKRMMKSKANMSSRQVANKLADEGKMISHQTVLRVSHEKGLNKKKTPKTFHLTEPQKQKRVVFARKHLHARLSRFIFLDESYVVDVSHPNTRNDGHWLPANQEPKSQPVRSHPRSISVFALISTWGKSELHYYTKSMDSQLFTRLVRKALKEIDPNHQHNATLVMDSATIHTSKHTTRWLDQHNIKYIPKEEWPASSPDFNPIENVWSTLQYKVRNRSPKTMIGLKRVATEVWKSFTQAQIAAYV